MIAAWLDQSDWGIFLGLLALYGASGAIIHWACYRPAWRNQVLGFSGVVAPFFVAPAIIFALLTSFLANDVWERDRVASRAILEERDGLSTINELSRLTGPAMPKLRAAVRDYATSVLRDEWHSMQDARESPVTVQALDLLLHATADPAMAQQGGAALQNALLSATLRVAAARSTRFALSSHEIDQYKWASVLILAILAQTGVAVVHLERQKAQVLALGIFTASAITALGLIAVCEEPYHGSHQVSPAPLQELVDA
jgi:hypothetical protein